MKKDLVNIFCIKERNYNRIERFPTPYSYCGFCMQEQFTEENENGPSQPDTEFRSKVNYYGMFELLNYVKSDNSLAKLTKGDNI